MIEFDLYEWKTILEEYISATDVEIPHEKWIRSYMALVSCVDLKN